MLDGDEMSVEGVLGCFNGLDPTPITDLAELLIRRGASPVGVRRAGRGAMQHCERRNRKRPGQD